MNIEKLHMTAEKTGVNIEKLHAIAEMTGMNIEKFRMIVEMTGVNIGKFHVIIEIHHANKCLLQASAGSVSVEAAWAFITVPNKYPISA